VEQRADGAEMKPSEILREAARRIERGVNIYGCCAIAEVSSWDDLDEGSPVVSYFSLVRPHRSPTGIWWSTEERDGARILGLCLAAAIAESEGK
jgi:hypothetical protein